VPELSRIPLDTDRGRRPDIRPWFRRRPGLPGEGDGEHPLAEERSQRFWRPAGIWAYSESPLVDGDAVVVNARRDRRNARGGSTREQARHSGSPWFQAASRPDTLPLSRRTLAASSSMCNSCRRALVGGTQRRANSSGGTTQPRRGPWRTYRRPSSMTAASTPASGMSGGGLALVIARQGAFDVEPKYFSKKLPNAIGGTVKLGDNLYGRRTPRSCCVDFASGEVKWEERSVGAGSLCAADGELYLHGENGEVSAGRCRCRRLPREGANSRRPTSRTGIAPRHGISGSRERRLYIRDLGSLWCYDIRARNRRK